MRKLTTLSRLSGRERLAIGEATILLIAARLLIVAVPLRYWRRHLSSYSDVPSTVDTHAREAVYEVGAAVRRAERNLPGEFLCLPQALAGRWMLARRGVSSQLQLGMRQRDDGSREHHAWLKVGPLWVTGHCREGDFDLFTKHEVPGLKRGR